MIPDIPINDSYVKILFQNLDFSPELEVEPELTEHGIKRLKFEKLLAAMFAEDILGREELKEYLQHKFRQNLSINTITGQCRRIINFLKYVRKEGRAELAEITRNDVAGYIEHEQDRDLKITTVHLTLTSIYCFLSYLAESEVIPSTILLNKLRLKLPDILPRAIDPDDIRRLLSVKMRVRDRALILLLLRTGMRIGELLKTKISHINIMEQKILIYKGEKNQVGRVVCFSDDAMEALREWLVTREGDREYLFYSQGRQRITYTAVRDFFIKYLREAGLGHKGYKLHYLRHTFATDLLNAGMRLECLQQLMGHSSIEITRRYARLSDRTREEEYFRAMSSIEKGEADGADQLGVELQEILEAEEHLG